MENDHLYRNPNLSLWDLSKHIGVTSNHLSQTLNETIGSTFFDYVNRWRVEEAANRVRDSSDTILAIAYDVGFNSKSSFYSAFKKHLGVTPSVLRHSAAPSCSVPASGGSD
ncbi:helix-turn-helix transcriptional regulator [Tritonibacter scottomollicae]|uniref:Helix-turn-helix transcriptional regulator n=1 Tax=Tritonibacter scottomollicae TaxID=483013 RepID=A0ABZ0HLE2_TRISK|nr:helix-turn-helix transcriptional regulator [Tritonibacter scottomollicae]WOI35276.1 helix-turn-helix transcriptional regulator [Tritonibacter scottomollicae]